MPGVLSPSAWVPSAVRASMGTAARWCGEQCSKAKARGVCGHRWHRLHTRPLGDPPRDGRGHSGVSPCPQRQGGLRTGLLLRNSGHISRLPPSLRALGGSGAQAPASRALAPGPHPPPPRLASGPASPPPLTSSWARWSRLRTPAPLGERDSPAPAECGSGDQNPQEGDDGCGEGGGAGTGKTEVETETDTQRNSERGTDFPQTYPVPHSTRGSRPLLRFSALPDLFPGARR